MSRWETLFSRGYWLSPIGWLEIVAEGGAVAAIGFVDDHPGQSPPDALASAHPIIKTCCEQLEQYFAGERLVFDAPLAPRGTPFQLAAWNVLLAIPFGETITYGGQAARLGNPGAMRAVGGANHRNPIAIMIPCHRAVGKNRALVGYAAGLWRKERLLAHEAAVLNSQNPLASSSPQRIPSPVNTGENRLLFP